MPWFAPTTHAHTHPTPTQPTTTQTPAEEAGASAIAPSLRVLTKWGFGYYHLTTASSAGSSGDLLVLGATSVFGVTSGTFRNRWPIEGENADRRTGDMQRARIRKFVSPLGLHQKKITEKGIQNGTKSPARRPARAHLPFYLARPVLSVAPAI